MSHENHEVNFVEFEFVTTIKISVFSIRESKCSFFHFFCFNFIFIFIDLFLFFVLIFYLYFYFYFLF